MSVAFVTMHLLLFTYVRQLSFHAHAYSCMANSFDDDEFITNADDPRVSALPQAKT